jgi:hypothetical protein
MNVNDFSSEFPNEQVSANNAVEAIVDKFPSWVRDSRFTERDFVEFFQERVKSILSRFPIDPDERKLLEIDLAYIMYRLSNEYGIEISCKTSDEGLRGLREQLVKENLLIPFTQFSRGETEVVDLEDPRDMLFYLDYLYGCAFLYVDTLVRLSQVPYGSNVFQFHLDDLYDHIEEKDVDTMLLEQDYLGWKPINEHLREIRNTVRWIDGEILTVSQARAYLTRDQRTCARFHIFLNHIAVKAITPQIARLPKDEQKPILDRLNDLRDIVDPEMYVPASFINGNTLEQMARMRWQDEGREVH